MAPLNNWANDFICFKVAAYPSRIYYGDIDVGKIDIVNLDFYNLYSKYDKSTMESLSANFTQRLIGQRLAQFCSLKFDDFFDTTNNSPEEYYDLIFRVSMNVPRIIGYILYYCHQTHISIGKKINKGAIENAAETYYEQVISKFFDIATHSLISFNEKVSELQQKEILTLFVTRLKNIKKQIVTGELPASIYNKDRKNPYCSHFSFQPNFEHFLRTLELNFFITKYNELVNKDGVKVSIYGLNYGLARSENLKWGKPDGNLYRGYFVERPFDFNKDIEDFLRESKKIVCINTNCSKTYPYEQLSFLQFNKMRCIECQSPVEIRSFSESIMEEITKIDNAKLLPRLELMILHELHKAGEKILARDIAEELDASSQLIAKRAEKLDKKGLVLRDKSDSLIKYSITNKAIEGYFHDNDV
ncbi:MarR family transcriptional regulator [Cronobacter dublinensis]